MPQDLHELTRVLRQLDGRGYGDYKRVKGRYDAGGFDLIIDHVQGDPFATPTRVRALVPPADADTPDWITASAARRVAAADYLNRRFWKALRDASAPCGSGRSGELTVLEPGQEILVRSSVRVGAAGEVEGRFRVGLPARGRRILGHEAARMLSVDVVEAVRRGLCFSAQDEEAFGRHVRVAEDAAELRAQLDDRGLIAFVADGAVLPRRSGVDDRPRPSPDAVPFQSPESLRVTLEAPHAGQVGGMGIPSGVTLIVGGGYHGKSTLLRALERGVYDHVPDDGRERVVAVRSTVKVRAEDGRNVAGTDISNFIGRLPDGSDTRRFHTANASGSTSQAAAIIEALEVGATCLLLDEDTSATNFMIRDARMQALVAAEDEPITPFIDRARTLYDDLGVSTVLVVGGSGDYFDVADTVVALRAYEPEEVTEDARRIAARRPTHRGREGGDWRPIAPRVPDPRSVDPSTGRRAVDVRVHGRHRLAFGRQDVDLSALEQIVEPAQVRAMAEALVWARDRAVDGVRPMTDALRQTIARIDAEGLDIVHPDPIGELAEFRVFELAGLLNRIRTLRMA